MAEPTRRSNRTAAERQRVEQNLRRLREAIGREVGWAPTARTWILPILAFAVGATLALNRRSRRRRLGASSPAAKLGPRPVPRAQRATG